MGFSDQIRAFGITTSQAHDKVVRETTIALFTSVITETPVDEGAAKGSWQTTVAAPAEGQSSRVDPSGRMAIAEAMANTPAGAGQVTFLTSNLAYIERLENGWSMQAPNGMVKRNVTRFQRMVDESAARNRV
ncbi:HK97 gp10 family phage protein [Pseudomonas lactis]|uniref:HK97 gp10 family phage protein n=1 Tax=Pseudomonas lactis TaxID=1615674 RepID=UPI00110C78B5|nr:HK97 gp10 family phage protein [Pseudomonas lactis]